MKSRTKKYLKKLHNGQSNVFNHKNQIQANPDNRIDQDYPGYPHPPSKEEMINPKTKEERATAAINIKDGEKINDKQEKIDEQQSDGSGGAFSLTEKVTDDEL